MGGSRWDILKRWIKTRPQWARYQLKRSRKGWRLVHDWAGKLEWNDMHDLVIYFLFPIFFLRGVHWAIVVPISIVFPLLKAAVIIAERSLHECEIEIAQCEGKIEGIEELGDRILREVKWNQTQ